LKGELQIKETKLANAEAELDQSTQMGGMEQLNAFRKAKQDLTMKVKDQVCTDFNFYALNGNDYD